MVDKRTFNFSPFTIGLAMDKCEHSVIYRGADAPRVYGTFRTEVCRNCGAFRFNDHHNNVRGDWKPKEEYAAATAPVNDE